MGDELVLVEHAPEGYAVLTFNRPKAMNALSAPLRQALAEAITQLAAEPSCRVLILTGAGRAFCAGLDLKELGSVGEAPALGSIVADPMKALAGFNGPVIAAVNGASDHRRLRTGPSVRYHPGFGRSALCRHSCPGWGTARLGVVAKAATAHWPGPRKGIVADRQFPRRSAG